MFVSSIENAVLRAFANKLVMHKEGFSLIAVGQCLYGLHDLLLRIGKVFVNRLHRCTELFGLLLIEQRHVAAAAGCMQHCSNLCAPTKPPQRRIAQ